jgi:hypothetical protein
MVAVPAEAIEGAPLKFRIAYTAPERVMLHAEIKDVSNVVHVSNTREVEGTGVADFVVTLPSGRFNGQLMIAYWFGEDWRTPRIPIAHVGPIYVYTAEEARQMAALDRQAASTCARLGLNPKRPTVAVLSGGWAGRRADLADACVRSLQAVGLRCVKLGPDEVASRGVLKPGQISMLVVPEAQTYPGEGIPVLLAYLRGGGHIIALGAPAFDRLVRRVPGVTNEWMDEAQITERIRQTPANRTLLDMQAMTDADWSRSANDMGAACSWHMVSEAPSGHALLHEIGNLTGWETLEARLTRVASPGDNLVTFRARGGPDTSMLAVELREKDGSRWIATTSLTPQWRRYALPVSAFRLWDPDHKSGRGGPKDTVRLTEIASVSVGLAFTHTTVAGGRHRYWFADLGSARGPDMVRYTVPTLDTLSPEYKLYPVRQASKLDGSHGSALFSAPTPAMPRHILSTHPRPTGTGFDKGRKWRWIPLLQVHGPHGVAGTVATLMVHLTGPYALGRWASFTAADPEWYMRPDVQRYVAALARRMLQPAMLAEGGSQFYGVFPDEKPVLGARLTQTQGAGLSARIEVREKGQAKPAFSATVKLKDDERGAGAEVQWKPDRLTASRYLVTTTLLDRGRRVDAVSHELSVRTPGQGPKEWVTVRDGHFMVGNRPWYPHGVNYMPSSGVAAEDGHYFEQWLSSESYDPLVIERDLARVRAAGFDMVSVFIYTESTHNHNLVDLLNRCDAHGLRVNLSLRPGTPLDFEWPAIGEIIKANRLADDPTVFAYDLAWEPAWGFRDQRRRWDAEWEEWIRQRYGSIEAAERDWGEQVPREDGRVAGPSDADVTASSAIPRVVAAYRRFQDDLLSRKHMEARQKIRTVDTRHLLSFRMSIAGDPTCGPTIMPYDFAGLARSMDFMAPEGYGRIGERDRVRPGWFTTAYARMAAPGRPVLWAEFGNSIWNRGEPSTPATKLSFEDAFDHRHYAAATIAFTERYYREFYMMTLESGADGTVCWWYPGGFRFGENSDFGIINPDGTWRGLTRIIAEYSRRFARREPVRAPDAWITVDRDRHPDGIYGMYGACKDEFWRLVNDGRFPGLRTEGDDADSASAPLVAVGGVPCTGSNPPRHLNAEFESVEVRDRDGRWVVVPYEGGTVRVRSDARVSIRIVAGNNGSAKWLSRPGAGQVRVIALADNRIIGAAAIALDVPRYGTSEPVMIELEPVASASVVAITMEADGRSRFGERRRIELIPDQGGR